MTTTITKKQLEKLQEEFIVLENPKYCGDEKFYIAKRSNFEMMNLCDTYDTYGQPVDSYDCGCDIKDEDGDVSHWEVLAYNFWNGSNWATTIIGAADMGGIEEASEKDSISILSELPESPYIDGISETIETENHSFFYSRMGDFNWICTVD